jgi:hypothetical protein
MYLRLRGIRVLDVYDAPIPKRKGGNGMVGWVSREKLYHRAKSDQILDQ